jgi:hypothetical protein
MQALNLTRDAVASLNFGWVQGSIDPVKGDELASNCTVALMELGMRSSSAVDGGLVVTEHAALLPDQHTKTLAQFPLGILRKLTCACCVPQSTFN